MSPPPAKKKKLGLQLTLFGGIATGQAVHKNAANLYEKFVDGFLVRHLHWCSARADAVRKSKENGKK